VYNVVVKKFMFAVSSRDELLVMSCAPHLVIEQYNSIPANGWSYPTAGKVTGGLAILSDIPIYELNGLREHSTAPASTSTKAKGNMTH